MSETNKKLGNTAIAYGDMKAQENGIIIDQGNYGPSKNEINNLAGMEIKVEGYEIVFDEKSGELLRVKDKHIINKITGDKSKKIIYAMKNKENKEEFEH